MFSGKKFRLWSKHSSSKKDAEKESPKDKSTNTSLPKGEDESYRQPTAVQEKSRLQKLQEDYARLEETVEELTPFKNKACALEKKLIYVTKSFEKKQSQYSTAIASLEVENEKLREEIRRIKSVCGSCYFCSRRRMMTAHPEAVKQHFHSSRRTDHGSSESLGSSESWRRLQKLEEEQSAIAKETSRQKQETSRCLEQISSEVMKAIVSQKALRKDCTRLQCRILQLEKQNSQLNEVIFRQYPPSSQMNFLAAQRNEVSAYRPQLASAWDEHSLHSTSSLDTIKDEGKTTSHKLFRIPPGHRLSKEICRPVSDCMSNNYIPEQVTVNSNSTKHMGTNHDHQNAPFYKDVKLVDSEPKNARGSLCYFFDDIKDEGKSVHNWQSSTGSTLTLRDETVSDENDSLTNQHKNSFSRGSTFSLNDILDGDIGELQLSIQSRESTKNNDTSGKTDSIGQSGNGKETQQHQNDFQQQNSRTVMFSGDTKDPLASQVTSFSCPSRREQILKAQKEQPQVPFSRASKDVQSVISFDNCSVATRNSAAEKRHRYSYPTALSDKRALKSEVHEMYSGQTEKSTGINKSESTKALQTYTKQQHDAQKFRLSDFETFFDNSDAEKLGTIKERIIPVTGSRPQIAQPEVRPRRATAEKVGAGKSANESAKIVTPVQGDMLQGTASWRTASVGTLENESLSKERVLGGRTSTETPAQQNLSQKNVSERYSLQETPSNGDGSDGNPLMGSSSLRKALWANNWRATHLEANPSGDNPSLAMHIIKQDTASTQEISPNCYDCKPEQTIWSEEQKQEQHYIPTETVDINAKMEDLIRKKRERFDFISSEKISRDLAKDVVMSKEKVMALTAYFEEVHAEQCPDCQQSGSRCKISSAYRFSSSSKDNSSFEDDLKQVDGNRVKELEQNQTEPQDHAVESLKTREKYELPKNEIIMCQLSLSDSSVCNTSIHETPNITSDDSYTSENFLASDTGLKLNQNSRANSQRADDSQTGRNCLNDEMEKVNKIEPEQSEHNLISFLNESKSVNHRIENTKNYKNGDLKMCLLGGKNLTKTPNEQMMSKRIQWASLPSVSLSTPCSQPPFQIDCIRTLSLKSFSDTLTPPPSPKLHQHYENSKPLGCHFLKCNEDVFNFSQNSQEPQHQTEIQTSDQSQGNSQRNSRSCNDPTEKESQSCHQNYTQVHCQGHIQPKQFTGFREDESEAQNDPQETRLRSQVHSVHQGQFKDFRYNESHFCAQNYPQDDLQVITVQENNPSHHSPKINPFPAEKEFTTRLQPGKECLLLPFAKIQPDDRRADLTSCVYPDLVSGSCPRPSICRTQRIDETERKCNVLTEEDIMKYRLDCHDCRTTRGSYPDLQPNNVSLTAMGSPGYSNDLRMLTTKPPLPPRRFQVTKCGVRDSSNPSLDPQDFLNFENEILRFSPGTPQASATRTGNEVLSEPNQRRTRTPVWEMDENCGSHSRGVDFNYQGADAMWQDGGKTNSLALQSAKENTKAGICASLNQGYQSGEGWPSTGKRNSYPDGSGMTYSQPQVWWGIKGIAAETTCDYPLKRHQTTRPVSAHQANETANYSFSSPLRVHTVQRELLVNCQQLEGESSQKNKKHTESDVVFNEISRQIENLQQTISELQKKSTEN